VCLKIGSPWVHLRLCRTCGHVGCCDDSPNRHATKHFHQTRHPIIEGYDPPEGWGWCYIDEIMLDLSDRATPHNGPIPRFYCRVCGFAWARGQTGSAAPQPIGKERQ
jgi:Zn-finger in ubiquitin-hydrolases and other protein